MHEPILEVRFYAMRSGREPVRDFLRGFSVDDRRAVDTDIKTVQFGWPLGMPLVRKLDEHLWETRSTVASGIVRVLFSIEGKRMVLLHAFVKKSQKTPGSDLVIARRRLRNIRGN